MSADEVRMGIHRHYKGPLYQVLGLAHDANKLVPGPRQHEWSGPDAQGQDVDGDRTCIHCGQDPRTWMGEWCEQVPRTVVVYMPLQLDGTHLGPRMAVRTLEDFMATLPLTIDGAEIAGSRVPRFKYLGPVLTQEMMEGS